MFKRIVSLLLCIVMVLSYLPAGALPARAEEEPVIPSEPAPEEPSPDVEPTPWIHIKWDGEVHANEGEWDSSMDLSMLPTGVTYDPDTLTLTLVSAKHLTWLNFTDFCDQAITLVVEGETTITGDATALNFHNCHNVTIKGSGTLNLTGYEYPFGWHDYNGTDPSEFHTDGTLTISGVTLNCTNLRTETPEGYTDEDWSWFTPITLGGGNIHVTDNATLTCEGLGFIGVHGSMVVDGGATVNGSGLHINMWTWESGTEPFNAPSLTVGETGTVNLYRTGRTLDTHSLFWLCPNSSLILEGGKLNIEEYNEDCPYSVITTGSAEGNVPGGRVIVNSGELNISTGNYVSNAIQIGDGASYTQTGGSVTVTADRDGTKDFQAIEISRSGSFTLKDGSITVENTAEELAQDSWVNGIHVDKYAGEALVSGGSVTTRGLFAQDLALDGKLTVSGGDIDVRIIRTFYNGANLTMLGGDLHCTQLSTEWGGQFQMLGGNFTAEYLVMEGGYARFLGGETTVTHAVRVHHMDAAQAYSYGDGIHALYADTGEAIAFADAFGDEAYSGQFTTQAGRAVSIKRQGVASDSFTGMLELMNGSYLSTGAMGTLRLITSLPAGRADVTVTLPAGLMLAEGSVTVDGKAVSCSAGSGSFTVNILNGEVIRFGVIAAAEGSYTVTAAACGNTVSLDLNARAYSLAIPASVNEAVIPVSGTAAPGAMLTFYANGSQLLTVTANSLGTWSARLPLGAEGIYSIRADIAVGGTTVSTEDYSVTYNDTTPVVETLTITNTIHGNTDADPNRDVSVVINYREGTRSQNYYTYWPELPNFRFAVKFSNGTPDTVARVAVVATDYFGAEQAVPMTYDEADGLWKGTAEFCGDGDLVPEMFRVEWVPLVDLPEKQEPESPEPEAPEAHEENHTEDAIVVSDSLSYRFTLSEGASGLTVTDDAGNPVTVTGNTFTGETGKRYCATLVSGTFSEFGTRSLYILMPASGESSFTLKDNVHEGEAEGYAVGDVVILGDEAWVITAVNSDGSYVYAEAALEDVFETLYMDGLTLSEGDEIIVEGDPEAAITQAFLESDFFAEYTDTLNAYGEAERLSAFGEPELEVEFSPQLSQGDNNTTVASIKVEIFVASTATANIPGGEVETKVGYKLTYEITRVFDLRIDKDASGFHGASFYVDTTETQTHGIEVTIEGESNTEMTEELEEYFDEEWDDEAGRAIHDFLTKLTDPEEKDVTAPICNLRIPTSIPFVFIEMGIDFVLKLEFSGSASLNLSFTYGDLMGVVITADRAFKPFYQSKPLEAKAFAEFHVEAKTGFMLKGYFGARLLNLLTLHFTLELGPTLRVGGHGSSTISTNAVENGVKAEGWIGTAFDYSAGLEAKLNLAAFSFGASFPLLDGYFPLSFVGSDKMPYGFTTVEKNVYVYDKCDITQLISHSMDYQRFSTGLKKESGVLEEERYTRVIENGRFILDGTELRVANPLQECEDWLILTYTSENAGYQIIKRVKLIYKPSSIIINKSACCASPEAGFYIQEIPEGPRDPDDPLFRTSASTDSSGIVVVPVEPNKRYRVTETSAPAEHYCVSPKEGYYEIYVGNDAVSIGFLNLKKKETPDNPLPSNGDPSGYVFEGIESNRLEGVTVTLLRSDSASGEGAVTWNAAEFDQENPLITDAFGQYLWMVPSGWYQVNYSLSGYDREASEWMAVPPIRTGVNQAMTSFAPAEFTVFYSEVLDAPVIRFNRPVEVNFREAVLTVNGEAMDAWINPLDADWSVTEDPADSTVCATVFVLSAEKDLHGTTVSLSIDSVTYAGTESSGSVSGYAVPEAHSHSYTDLVIDPTCTEPGHTTHTCACGDSFEDSYTDPLGHSWMDANCEEPQTCSRCGETEGEALGHDFADGTCARCGEADPDYVEPEKPTEPEPAEPEPTDPEPTDPKPEDPADPSLSGVIRIAGADRIGTSLQLADQLKEVLRVEKFDAVVVASALNFPDALTGSYLAAVKDAPILLTYEAAHPQIRAYIQNNLKPGGMVYILGGESAVSNSFATGLNGFNVKRVAGSDRFGTNLAIMKEAGVSVDQPILIATALNFADSLSASAAGLPMVLVYGSLRPDQKEFLATTSRNFIIIGGTSAVSEALEAELKAIGTVERLAGAGRYQTSVMVAQKFVQNPDDVVLAYARNFPDGLCGGPLAYALGAPLILTDNYDPATADAYVEGISAGIVVGGSGLISDDSARAIFDLAANAPITAG